jgi:hypothetical protein
MNFEIKDIMQLKKIIFFAPENMKKTSSKVAHKEPQILFSVLP